LSIPSDPAPREDAAAPTGLSVPEAALVVGIVLVWASLYPAGKLTFTEITPSQLTFVRAALASVVLLAVCAATGRLRLVLAALRPPRLGGVLVLGLSGFALSAWLSMAALGHLPAGVSSLLSNSSPLMVAAVAVLLLRERTDRRTVSGIIVGFAGVALVVLRGGVDARGVSTLGVVLGLLSAAFWAVYTALMRRLVAGQDTLAVGAATALVGAVPLAVVAEVDGGHQRLLAASATTHLILLWCGVMATGMTFTMWVSLLKRIPAANAATFQYLIPLFALFLALPIAGEPLTVPLLLGAAMIVGGVTLANINRG
jgi:drug/metabolite transporter (DMT)-like permease